MAYYEVRFRATTNADFRAGFTLNTDLTDATLKMDVRKNPRTAAVLTLSTANGRITIADEATGEIALVVPAATMATIPLGSYQHDLIVTTAEGVVIEWWKGTLSVEDGVTE